MANKATLVIYSLVFTVLAVCVGLWFYLKPQLDTALVQVQPTPKTVTEPAPEQVVTLASPPAQSLLTPSSPTISPTPSTSVNLPPLNQSDDLLKSELAANTTFSQILGLVTPEEIVRKTARAVYQTSQGRVVKQYRPIASPSGPFRANKIADGDENTPAVYSVSPKNFSRYQIFIDAVTSISPELAASTLKHYLPLFEEAYAELGLAEGSFTEALHTSINLAISTPDVGDDFALVQPSVMYKFKNPELEALPQVQKLMIRIGQDNRSDLSIWLKSVSEQLKSL